MPRRTSLSLSMEDALDRRDLKGVVINLVDGSSVAQAKPARSGFDPFEGPLFCAFLIFINGVFLSMLVNEFKFAYLIPILRLSDLRLPNRGARWT